MDLNKVFLLGRLGSAPVQRETKTGTVVTHFSLATSHRKRKKEGANAEGAEPADSGPLFEEETQWHKIVAWGKQGEICSKYLKKGSTVLVEGSVRARKYQIATGESRLSVEIHAEGVMFIGGKNRNGYAEVAQVEA